MRKFPRFSLATALVAFMLSGPLFLVIWNTMLYYQESRSVGFFQGIFGPREKSRATSLIGIGPVLDDTVILIRRGNAFGAFIPTRQSQSPASIEYKWFYRTDGKSLIEISAPQGSSGTSTARGNPASPFVLVEFGPFSILWSERGPGSGWLYYEDRANASQWQQICITNESALTSIDLSDKKWVFKP